MKTLKKLFVITIAAALLLSSALADEKIYTSPVFKLPADKITNWAEAQEAAAQAAEEAALQAEEGEQPAAEEGELAGEWTEGQEAAGEEENGETAVTGEEGLAEAGTEETGDGETGEEAGEAVAEGEEAREPEGEGEETAPEGEDEARPVERKVRIFSSQGDVVTEGEIITLTSTLEGFDGLEIAFQWQVDRGDGAGWVDVEGANRSKHSFIASRETIQYSWRLVVNVIEQAEETD